MANASLVEAAYGPMTSRYDASCARTVGVGDISPKRLLPLLADAIDAQPNDRLELLRMLRIREYHGDTKSLLKVLLQSEYAARCCQLMNRLGISPLCACNNRHDYDYTSFLEFWTGNSSLTEPAIRATLTPALDGIIILLHRNGLAMWEELRVTGFEALQQWIAKEWLLAPSRYDICYVSSGRPLQRSPVRSFQALCELAHPRRFVVWPSDEPQLPEVCERCGTKRWRELVCTKCKHNPL